MTTSVKKIMTKNLVTAPTGTNLFDASELMKEKRIRHLPIVDSNDDLVGIITQRDLLHVREPQRIPVELLMSSPVHFVSDSTPLRRAIFLMLQKKISCLLIADDDDNATGIITTDDLLWHLSHLLADENLDHPALSYKAKQTIGEVARQLSQMGI